MSFQTCVNCFLLWNTKENVQKGFSKKLFNERFFWRKKEFFYGLTVKTIFFLVSNIVLDPNDFHSFSFTLHWCSAEESQLHTCLE